VRRNEETTIDDELAVSLFFSAIPAAGRLHILPSSQSVCVVQFPIGLRSVAQQSDDICEIGVIGLTQAREVVGRRRYY
jgi:hypothetical protein